MKWLHPAVIALVSLVMPLTTPYSHAQSSIPTEMTVTIDAKAASTPFTHFWETTFGSGRATLSLRESYRNDLRAVKDVTELSAVRFHGIFMDDVGLYDPDRKPIKFAQMANTAASSTEADSGGIYNFSYVDQIYDGLLANGVRPFVELSFMPKKMASDPAALHAFWYKQNVSPPKDYTLWDNMITAFAQHLIERYGIEEVSHWSFEVWNEPNIDFWVGNPKQPTYFTLYDHTALALKKVSQRLRVGGPSTCAGSLGCGVPAALQGQQHSGRLCFKPCLRERHRQGRDGHGRADSARSDGRSLRA